MNLSFIIPAFNEEAQLGPTLAAIDRTLSDGISFDVIVVDNGSVDRTIEIAAACGARVITRPHGTIGSLRNEGARSCTGRYLVFLDADVVLGDDWGQKIHAVLDHLDENPRTLAGGMCMVPDNANLLQRVWFKPRETSAFSHLGTGHLLTTRAFFLELAGFDEALETGEDYDLSRRAMMVGGKLLPTPELAAEHRGFPSTLMDFIRREAWHGKSDFRSLEAFLSSKVALLAALFALGHIFLLASLVRGSTAGVVASSGMVFGICAGSAFVKYRHNPFWLVWINCGLYYVYFLARFLAGAQSLFERSLPNRHG